MNRTTDPRFAPLLRQFIAQTGMSYRQLAALTFYSKSHLQELATGRKQPSPECAARLDTALGAVGTLACLAIVAVPGEDEAAAAELADRVAATDVSSETLQRLQIAFDDLATCYATLPPEQLIPRVRKHLAYVKALLDARMTLAQQREVIVIGGWLSLLGATLHIDLRQPISAAARLATANQLATAGEHPEIRAWCLETRAWELLTRGDFRSAAELSRQAQAIAPQGSSALIQATAQEGRAYARMHEIAATRDALDRVNALTSSLPTPDRPEHHYRYDPDKALAYTATTLSWSGDPAAEDFARAVIVQLTAGGIARPRRVASANLDLGLALVANGKPDEAVAAALTAVSSHRVVKSNWWRVDEILSAVEHAGLPEARDLKDACETYRP